ncbi:hypothetical protein TrVGV298_001513 [Trichoderma virens]|nr:hypothetical protein TrVGV298_001513 [Trichoderma virens]
MDPLSITASVIAIVQLTAAVGSGFQRLMSLRGASDQLLQVMNEVTDLEALARDMQSILQERDEASSLDSATLATLPGLCQQVTALMQELKDIVQGCLKEEITSTASSLKIKRIAWLRAADKMNTMQARIRAMRLRLSSALASIQSLDMIRVRLVLQNLSLAPGLQAGGGNNSDHLSDIARRFENIEGIPEQIRQILEILKPTPPASMSAGLTPVVPKGRTAAEELVTHHMSKAVNPGTRLAVNGQTIRLTFNAYSTQRLARPCPCRCHTTKAAQTSKLFQKAIGQLFVGYAGQVSHLKECKKCPCVKANDAKVNLTYYFPSWFVSRAVEVIFRSSELYGPSLSLRTHRVIPDESPLFHFAKLGMIPEIQLLFQDKMASPFDISSKTGRSALHFAADWGQEEMCSFLIRFGADAHYEDKYLMSPFDIVWEKRTERRPKTAAAAFGLENDSYDMDLLLKRALRPLHRAVLGLSPVDVATQLESSWLEVNKQDYWGRVPLSWAAGRGDVAAVELLIQWEANVAIPDKGGWTCLHHAARAEDSSCIQALIEAGAPINIKNNRGNTPLAVACSYRDSPEHVLPFIQGGADLASPMKDGFTPLAICAKHNHVFCAKALVDHGASVDGIENGMAFPISVAASYNSHETLLWLLSLGKNHSRLDHNRWSLLHHVALLADKETMEILTEAHLFALDPELESIDGMKPRDIFLNQRKLSLNESPAMYLESKVAFEALLDSIDQRYISTSTSPSSLNEDWYDALDKMELGDTVASIKEATVEILEVAN